MATPANRSIAGKVASPSGTAIAKAKLTITNAATGKSVAITVNDDGTFLLTNVAPGAYELAASAPGFVETRATITVRPDADQIANVTLVPIGMAKSSAVSGVINSTSVSELPLNGRSATDLAALEPGVATARTQVLGQGQRGFGMQMTISGGRPRQNDARLDGISVNDYTNGPPGSALGVNLGSDGVEQFTVLTSNYPAGFGRSSGGIIGATTRPGKNDFHGDAFEYLRNSAFDARNFFDIQKPPFRRNQFGGSLGGPIQKGKTFFFVDYEGLRQSLGITQVDTVPSAAARAGNLSTGTVTVDPAVSRFLNSFFPLPNGPLLGPGDTGLYSFAGQEVTPENYFTARIDRKLSDHDQLYGTFMLDNATVTHPDELGNKDTGYDSQRRVYTLHEAHTFSTQLANSFRAGISRVVTNAGLTFPASNAADGNPSFGSVPGQNVAGIAVPGLTTFSAGLNGISNYHFHWTSLQAYDDVTLVRGKHSLTFGAGVERIRDNILGDSNPAGEFSFNSLADFLTNRPFFFGAAIPSTISERGIRQTVANGYAQDDWRVFPNLTINLGLRYEMASVPTEVHNNLTALPSLTAAAPHLGSPLFSNPTLENFEPRVGFSWDPFKDGKSTLSGGFGVFDVLPLPYLIQFNEVNSAPYFEQGNATVLPIGAYPTLAFNAITASSNTFRQAYFDPNPQRNYVMQWNLTLQRQLAKDLNLKVGYVGSRGVHQPFRVEDADIVMPTLTSAGYLWPAPIGSGIRLNPNAGRITSAFWDGNSYYNALQVNVKKIFSHGSQFGASYTWGKSIDTGSGSLVGDEYLNSISSPLWFNPGLNRGLSDFNVAQNLELNYTWNLRTPHWSAPILNSKAATWAAEGWELGGVFEASTGVPFTPGFAGDTLGVNSIDPNIDLPNLVGGPGCGSLVNPGNPLHYINTQCFAVPAPTPAIAGQCVNVVNVNSAGQAVPNPNTCLNLRGNLGRNTLIGPGLMNFDFSLFKNNYVKRISDTFNVQFRAEFFNVLNHTNFAPPLDNRNIFDSSGHPIANAGLIDATQTPSREIQFALKVVW